MTYQIPYDYTVEVRNIFKGLDLIECLMNYNEGYTHLNTEFQRIARRDKKAFLSNQCKEIEENNRIGKTRDLFKKIRYQGNISCKDGLNKGQKWLWT